MGKGMGRGENVSMQNKWKNRNLRTKDDVIKIKVVAIIIINKLFS